MRVSEAKARKARPASLQEAACLSCFSWVRERSGRMAETAVSRREVGRRVTEMVVSTERAYGAWKGESNLMSTFEFGKRSRFG